jgi:murein DD-endopeptidase MepM/ murein hydrolase activator NlpD
MARWRRWTTRWSSWRTPPRCAPAERDLPAADGLRILETSIRPGGRVLRQPAIAFVLLSIAFLIAACGGSGEADNDDDGGVIITPLATQDVEPTSAVVEPTSEATAAESPAPEPTQPAASPLSGFVYPIAGGCLPSGDQLMPNAPREYRNGIHEGVDFYNVDNCTEIGLGTPVVAAKTGTVIRADFDYVDLTAERYAEISQDLTSAESLDEFRGRQIWIDRGDGIVTRYCHLSGIAEGIVEGTVVNTGDVIAYVGESGTPESINNPGSQYHLHFEVRVGDSFLGAGLPPQEVRALYLELFGQ